MSKGSKRRPPAVPDKQVEENWQRIFGKKKCVNCYGAFDGGGEFCSDDCQYYYFLELDLNWSE